MAIVAVLVAFVAKVAFEFATSSTVFVDNAAGGFVPVPLAHLAGAVVGAGAALVPVREPLAPSDPPLAAAQAKGAPISELQQASAL